MRVRDMRTMRSVMRMLVYCTTENDEQHECEDDARTMKHSE
jgi:hypothetical protein